MERLRNETSLYYVDKVKSTDCDMVGEVGRNVKLRLGSWADVGFGGGW